MPVLPVETTEVPSGNSLKIGTERGKKKMKGIIQRPLVVKPHCTQENNFLPVASTWFLGDLESHQPREDLGVLEDPDSAEGRKRN